MSNQIQLSQIEGENTMLITDAFWTLVEMKATANRLLEAHKELNAKLQAAQTGQDVMDVAERAVFTLEFATQGLVNKLEHTKRNASRYNIVIETLGNLLSRNLAKLPLTGGATSLLGSLYKPACK